MIMRIQSVPSRHGAGTNKTPAADLNHLMCRPVVDLNYLCKPAADLNYLMCKPAADLNHLMCKPAADLNHFNVQTCCRFEPL